MAPERPAGRPIRQPRSPKLPQIVPALGMTIFTALAFALVEARTLGLSNRTKP